jgi:hypothetical protein
MELLSFNSEKVEKGEAALELELLLKELKARELPKTTVTLINEQIKEVNDLSPEAKGHSKKIKAAKSKILNLLEKGPGLVPKNYYATLWLPLGMSAFGLPIGTVIYVITGNVAFIGIGLPIGLAIGSLYGACLDKKAEKEGRVLNFTQK